MVTFVAEHICGVVTFVAEHICGVVTFVPEQFCGVVTFVPLETSEPSVCLFDYVVQVPMMTIFRCGDRTMLTVHDATPSGEIARHSTFEISGKKMTMSTNLVSVHTNLLCV